MQHIICSQAIYCKREPKMTKTPSEARGNATRQANKEIRRKKILNLARDLISSNGYESFTLNELASQASVTVPTIHNLFGKKADIFLELVEEMVVRIEHVLAQPNLSNPIATTEAFIENLLALFKADESFYKAAFVTGERSNLFEHELPTGIFNKSLTLAEQTCLNALNEGYLQGNIDSHWMALQLLGCQRLARQDWVNGYITIDDYKTQVLIGMLITFAADATPEFHKDLSSKINLLGKQRSL